MNYLKSLGFDREPFSNAPDPDFFFPSRQHYGCLQKIEVSIRLRRGLCVVVGEVGAGKTTICRQLIRRLAGDDEVETHLILDPGFENASEFLAKTAEMLLGRRPEPGDKDLDVKEAIKQHLFRRGVEQKKTVVMIIDEGQKIPGYCLEILREFLNYETNDCKLLQIVIFAQPEFEKAIRQRPNFSDRIDLYARLRPLSFRDTTAMIRYRLEQAAAIPDPPKLFTYAALWAVYRASGGYPRKIVNLCHLCTLAVLVGDKTKVDMFMVRACAASIAGGLPGTWKRAVGIGLAGALSILLAVAAGPRLVASFQGAQPASEPAVPIPVEPVPIAKAVELPEPPPTAWQSETLPREDPFEIAEAPTVAEAAEPAPVPTPPEIAPSVSEPAAPPEVLGRVIVQRGEAWSVLMRQVYGSYRSGLSGAMKEANPGIADPSVIKAGDEIVFPAVAAEVPRPAEQRWWVETARENSLAAAFDRLRSHADKSSRPRIVPCWSEEDGLSFLLVLPETFDNEAEAGRRALKIASLAGAETRVFTEWPEKIVLYADPYNR
jgi:general secretion pathway protein A